MRDKEEEAARYLQAHKDDADEWEEEGEKPSEGRPTGIAFSIEFNAEEIGWIEEAADRDALPISDLLRQAVIQYVSSARRPVLATEADRVMRTDVEPREALSEAPRAKRQELLVLGPAW
jgi:hypothetical protein